MRETTGIIDWQYGDLRNNFGVLIAGSKRRSLAASHVRLVNRASYSTTYANLSFFNPLRFISHRCHLAAWSTIVRARPAPVRDSLAAVAFKLFHQTTYRSSSYNQDHQHTFVLALGFQHSTGSLDGHGSPFNLGSSRLQLDYLFRPAQIHR